ncbi:MAG TPA: MBL fold metallo-hydrolase [Actinomycetota bacterium]|nr:MBL fold metallo-hydrolase [Actinomycetota bacterium]
MTTPAVIPLLTSEVRFPPADPAPPDPRWLPIVAHAVVHRDGVFLFDTGVGTGDDEIDAWFSPRVTLVDDALAAAGVAIDEVAGVANCHLHFDHGGQNGRLPPGVPIFTQRAEWRMVHEPGYTIARWIDVPGLRYELIDGDVEVAPGLTLVATPGHARGHQSLVVATDDGPVVLAGQAVWTRAEWEGAIDDERSGAPSAADADAYAASVARLRSLDPVRVHFAHDRAVWHRGGDLV